jgi:thioesterase domain-containing protein
LSNSLTQLDENGRLALKADLALWWKELLGIGTVGPHDDFFQLGGNLERGSTMLQRVKQEYKVSIPTSDLYEARTIDKLADLILMKLGSREQQCILPIRATGNRPPLFLVHGVGGNILGFAGLAQSLSSDQPVYGIQAQSLKSDSPTLLQLESMAEFYVQELRRLQPAGPYAFLGFSYGGLVAYEMAQQLVASGEEVHFLGMLDTWQPSYLKRVKAAQPWLKRALYRLYLVRMNTRKLSLFQMVPYAYIRLKSRVLRVAYRGMGNAGPVSLPDSMRRVRDINLMAAARYRVRPYPGTVTLFRAKDDTTLELPEDLDWRSFALGGVEIFRLPGDHGQILAEPNLSYMTGKIDECMGRYVKPVQPVREEFELDAEEVVALGTQKKAVR